MVTLVAWFQCVECTVSDNEDNDGETRVGCVPGAVSGDERGVRAGILPAASEGTLR